MGKLIQCAGCIAKEPYHFRLTKTNVYSIEEVCYYIRHNIYMMQEEIFDKEFVLWLRNELHMDKTAEKLERLIQEQHDIRDIVVTICCSCDYYGEEEINELIRIMEEIDRLPMYARRKKKGDHYLACKSYEKAIEEYEKILESDEILQAEPEVYGNVFHNMAVAYVQIGEFHKASELFLQAYEKNNSDESLAQCIFALRLSKDVEGFKKLANELKISQEKQSAWEQQYQRAMEKSASQKEVLQIEKLRNLLKHGNVEEYYDKVHRFIAGWKEDYRKQISV
ncbi:MAG: tetratricopeptide repeat protein [Butyribacter sp.]|nr:tetratricopeptide repeat protein [bacterium]MDY3854065.1 tetratricopeptide repeat protein [Butyribacter sp.]